VAENDVPLTDFLVGGAGPARNRLAKIRLLFWRQQPNPPAAKPTFLTPFGKELNQSLTHHGGPRPAHPAARSPRKRFIARADADRRHRCLDGARGQRSPLAKIYSCICHGKEMMLAGVNSARPGGTRVPCRVGSSPLESNFSQCRSIAPRRLPASAPSVRTIRRTGRSRDCVAVRLVLIARTVTPPEWLAGMRIEMHVRRSGSGIEKGCLSQYAFFARQRLDSSIHVALVRPLWERIMGNRSRCRNRSAERASLCAMPAQPFWRCDGSGDQYEPNGTQSLTFPVSADRYD